MTALVRVECGVYLKKEEEEEEKEEPWGKRLREKPRNAIYFGMNC